MSNTGPAAPAAPGTPVLAPISDTGIVGDNITKVVRPLITGTGTQGDTLTLYDGLGNDQVVVGTGTVDASGAWAITPYILLEGTHVLTATQTNGAGIVSAASGTLDVSVMTTPPPAPSALSLAAASDSGVLGDGITNVVRPVITGTGKAGALVTLYDGFANVGTGTVDITGQWAITSTTLATGTHHLSTRQTDPAGNTSPGSSVIDVTIAAAAAPPTVTQSSDTTNPAEPMLRGTAPDGATVIVSDGTATVGSVTADAGGGWSFAFAGPLATGVHTLTAIAKDTAGNLSAASAPLSVTIDPSGGTKVTTARPDGGSTDRSYDSGGTITASTTLNGAGQVLVSVTAASANLNIYDASGHLIGTITQHAGSAATQPNFVTNTGTGSAATGSGTAGSTITLLGESNVITSSGNDVLSAGPGADTVFAAGPAIVITGGAGSLLFVGGAGAATVTGGSGSSTLFGGAGGGVLQGGTSGHNAILAGGGAATVIGGGTGDILVGGSGTSVLVMTTNNVAFGGSGNSSIFGAGGGVMVGGAGDIVMVGSTAGGEVMWGGSGHTTEYAKGPNDTLVGGGSGSTTMIGGASGAVFVGIGGNVAASGSSGNDTFFAAGTGTMTITEGNGNDAVLLAGANTTVTGGTGSDFYAFIAQYGTVGANDVISGFKLGTDVLAFYGYGTGPVQQSVSGTNTVLSLSDGTNVTLLGVTGLPPQMLG